MGAVLGKGVPRVTLGQEDPFCWDTGALRSSRAPLNAPGVISVPFFLTLLQTPVLESLLFNSVSLFTFVQGLPWEHNF